MKTQAIFFAFDLFGSAGTGAGVHLLADELREILADNRQETVQTRARAYTQQVRLREVEFQDLEACQGWREKGRQLARQVVWSEDFLLWVSGNHLGVLPVYDVLAGEEDVLVVQLDAHLDIHHFRECSREPTHGNFLLHARGPLPALVNVGHRDLLLEREYIQRYYRRTYGVTEWLTEPEKVLGELRTLARKAKRIYLDVDWDVLDASHFPGVSQPVPFGLIPGALLQVVEAVWTDRLRGVFLSEFDPGRDRDDRSLAVVVWFVEYLLLRRYEAR